MFDERIPGELRLLLIGAFSAHQRLATALTWVAAMAAAPPEFDVVVRAHLQRMEGNAWALVERYRRGELSREEVESGLEADFDWDRSPSPELTALLKREEAGG